MGQPNNPLPQHYDGAIPTFGRCTKHGKVRFKSRSDAKKVARKNHNQNANRPGRLNAYRCDEQPELEQDGIEWWHIGSIPPRVRANWTRATFAPRPERGSK